MSFCCIIKDPALRYDLRNGSFHDGWEHFIPSLAERIQCDRQHGEHCGSCDLRSDCRWCGGFSWLENRRYSGPIPYLCDAARATREFRSNRERLNRRYFEIAGIAIEVNSDLPITDNTFAEHLRRFEVSGPGEDTIRVTHHFSLPALKPSALGQEVYRQVPWVIHRTATGWLYVGTSAREGLGDFHTVALANEAHTQLDIYHSGSKQFERGGLQAVSGFPTDQILLARVLPDRQACYIHSAGVIMNGRGLLFVGPSEAGKSTMIKMLQGAAEVLCDDRNIVRRWPEGYFVHGTWSHGEIPDISGARAPLGGVFFLSKAAENRILSVTPDEAFPLLLGRLIRPLVAGDWWEKSLGILQSISREVPCFRLEFDTSGAIADILRRHLEQ